MDNIFELVDGLVPIDPQDIVEFERTMKEEVIPEIVKVMKRREECWQVSFNLHCYGSRPNSHHLPRARNAVELDREYPSRVLRERAPELL